MANVLISDLGTNGSPLSTDLYEQETALGTSGKVTANALVTSALAVLNAKQNAVYATDGLVAANLEALVFALPNGATGDNDFVITYKMRVLAAAVILTAAGATDTTFALCGQIAAANYEIAAGGTLRWSHVRNAGSSAALGVVIGIKVT